jgi:hypothetical protein
VRVLEYRGIEPRCSVSMQEPSEGTGEGHRKSVCSTHFLLSAKLRLTSHVFTFQSGVFRIQSDSDECTALGRIAKVCMSYRELPCWFSSLAHSCFAPCLKSCCTHHRLDCFETAYTPSLASLLSECKSSKMRVAYVWDFSSERTKEGGNGPENSP